MYDQKKLIRRLLRDRLKSNDYGISPDKAAKLDPITLMSTPEATIVVLADTFCLAQKKNPNVPDKAIATLMYLAAEGCDALVATGVVPAGVWR